MKIAITFNLKKAIPQNISSRRIPEDAYEEFDTPETIEALVQVLKTRGHDVVPIEADESFIKNILNFKPDFVFNLAEGYEGRNRESHIPMILEWLKIPYSGSDGFTLAISLDKALTKLLARKAGVRTPQEKRHLTSFLRKTSGAFFPAFLKPVREGSSKGIRLTSLVLNEKDLKREITRYRDSYGDIPLFLEKFIPGPEITVGVLGTEKPEILGSMEINWKEPKDEPFIYSLEVKREWKKLVGYRVPPDIPKKTRTDIEDMAIAMHRALDCRDLSRVDFRLDKRGKPFFLEINPLPGLSPEYSDLVIMMRKKGKSYAELILSIFDRALKRYPQLKTSSK